MQISKSTQTSVPHIPNCPGGSYWPHTCIPWNFPTGCLFDLNPMSIGPSAAEWFVPVPVKETVVLPCPPLAAGAATVGAITSAPGCGIEELGVMGGADGTFFNALSDEGLSILVDDRLDTGAC